MTPIGRIIAATALAAALPAAHHAADRRGETKVYTLNPSTNGNPEGIAYDDSTGAFYVGATGGLEGSPGGGTIYRGTVDNPVMTEFIRVAGGEAAGMKVARGKLYVAGGFSGRVVVYDLATRLPVASFGNFGAGMLNDLVVTQQGEVYVTDSFVPRLWHITAAQVAVGGGVPEGIPVDPEIEYDFGPFSFNLNGIVALRGGRSLIVVQSSSGKLFRIDLDERALYGREIRQIAVEPLAGGDGLLLDGGDLIVVQGGIPSTLNFVRLNGAADRGEVIERRTDPALIDSSTVARAPNYYLVVNLDLATNTIPYTVVGLPRNLHDHE